MSAVEMLTDVTVIATDNTISLAVVHLLWPIWVSQQAASNADDIDLSRSQQTLRVVRVGNLAGGSDRRVVAVGLQKRLDFCGVVSVRDRRVPVPWHGAVTRIAG